MLHATASVSSLIQPEGEQEAVPDIFLQPDNCEPFWVEVTYITPRNQQQETDIIRFPSWVREELSKGKVADSQHLRIRLKPADTSKDVQVPPNNSWRQLLKTDKWKTFLAELKSGNFNSTLCLRETDNANVIVTIEGIEQGNFVSSSFPAPNVPKCAEDHPIYRKIKEKAEQAKKWERSGKKYEPLVLFIGASERLHQINDHGTPSSISLEQAVYSALADTEQWDLTTTLNAIGTAPWPGTKARRQRVNGSRLISAVVIVTIKNEYSGLRWRKRASRPIVIKNPHPDVELTAQQEQLLHQINLNQVEYGSGCESWEAQQSQRIPVALQRYKEREGRFVFSPGSDFSFNIEIRCNLVALFLAGDITDCEVWDNKNSGSDDYPTLKKRIGDDLRLAAELNLKIVNVNFVKVDPKLREQSRIRLEFGAFTAPTDPINDSPKAYIETDASGAFTLKLAQNLITRLLAGKITAGEVWKIENNKQIGDLLKNAVSRGQDIIDAKLVQVSSDPESEPALSLNFSAPTDTTIREDKKIIREEKKRRKN
ncbi:MAG: hypothetical protein RH949_15105 [Coleofasciculus sp. A1-SPW-01]|uniref:hypothetical protein n=1 Tax=Coleofasciculus sp. A1-SPW-01 TaxID=3070819 RepID=UPI0032F438BA